jgi:hypothetical protein
MQRFLVQDKMPEIASWARVVSLYHVLVGMTLEHGCEEAIRARVIELLRRVVVACIDIQYAAADPIAIEADLQKAMDSLREDVGEEARNRTDNALRVYDTTEYLEAIHELVDVGGSAEESIERRKDKLQEAVRCLDIALCHRHTLEVLAPALCAYLVVRREDVVNMLGEIGEGGR